MKYHIEKNTVQETLVIPLYGRKMCSELYPNLFRDETAVRLINEIDYDFSTLARKSQSMMQQFGFLECAMRQSDLACEVRDYLRSHPNAAVVGWTPQAAPVTTARAKFTTSTFPMSSPCAMRSCLRSSARRISPAT